MREPQFESLRRHIFIVMNSPWMSRLLAGLKSRFDQTERNDDRRSTNGTFDFSSLSDDDNKNIVKQTVQLG